MLCALYVFHVVPKCVSNQEVIGFLPLFIAQQMLSLLVINKKK